MGMRRFAAGLGIAVVLSVAQPVHADEGVPEIAKRMVEVRKSATSAQVAAALKNVKPEGDSDLAAALEAKSADTPGAKAALDTAHALRALAKIGTTAAAREVVKIAGDANGAYRPEAARVLKAMGDPAMPALIEAKKDPSFELRRWSTAQLEAMGKRLPGDAVQTKDNDVLADVLHAYGAVHDLDAVPVILSFVASDRVQVRSAAREATLAFGQDAVWKLREAYANVAGKPAQEGWTAEQTAKELFAAYDKLRLQEVYGLLDEGLAKQRDGKLDEAIADFDRVLARQPELDRRGEMAPAYVAWAQKTEDSDPAAARAAFEKAQRLAPDSAREKTIEAELAYLDGVAMEKSGVVDPEPYERALELDPANVKARAKLDALETSSVDRTTRFRAIAGGAAVLLLGILAAVLFGRFPRRRRLA